MHTMCQFTPGAFDTVRRGSQRQLAYVPSEVPQRRFAKIERPQVAFVTGLNRRAAGQQGEGVRLLQARSGVRPALNRERAGRSRSTPPPEHKIAGIGVSAQEHEITDDLLEKRMIGREHQGGIVGQTRIVLRAARRARGPGPQRP